MNHGRTHRIEAISARNRKEIGFLENPQPIIKAIEKTRGENHLYVIINP